MCLGSLHWCGCFFQLSIALINVFVLHLYICVFVFLYLYLCVFVYLYPIVLRSIALISVIVLPPSAFLHLSIVPSTFFFLLYTSVFLFCSGIRSLYCLRQELLSPIYLCSLFGNEKMKNITSRNKPMHCNVVNYDLDGLPKKYFIFF